MYRLVWVFFAIFIPMSACNQQLPLGYSEVGRFTGGINAKHYSLASTSSTLRLYLTDGTEEDVVDSDVEYGFKSGMHQYTIHLRNGLDEFGYGIPPMLKIIVRSDPAAADSAKNHLRIDHIALHNNGFHEDAEYAAQLRSGFGAIKTISLQTGKDGGIRFEFEANLSKVAMTGSKMTPVPDGGAIRIKGRFAGKVSEWENLAD